MGNPFVSIKKVQARRRDAPVGIIQQNCRRGNTGMTASLPVTTLSKTSLMFREVCGGN